MTPPLSEEHQPDRKQENQTRFALVGRESASATGHDKSSIVVSTKQDQAGSLVELLSEFATLNVNMTRICSRPNKQVLGEYVFFIDFEGHASESSIMTLLERIEAKASFYKFLGSYPIFEADT